MIVIKLCWWSEEKGLAEMLSVYLGRSPEGACYYAEQQMHVIELLGFKPVEFIVWDLSDTSF